MRSLSARLRAVTGHQSDIAVQLRAAWLALDPPLDLVDELNQNVLDKIVSGLAVVAGKTPKPEPPPPPPTAALAAIEAAWTVNEAGIAVPGAAAPPEAVLANPGEQLEDTRRQPDGADAAARREFRWASHAASLEELDRIAEVLDIGPALTAAIAGLHKPAIVALADAHVMRATLEGIAAASTHLVAAIERAKAHLPADDEHKPHAQPGGRPRDTRAQVVAGLVRAGYIELFGDEAPRAVGGAGVPALVTTIFKIMRIKADPKAAIIAARKATERTAEERAKVARSS